MARKVTYYMRSVADSTATFDSVADCKEQLVVPAHAELVNVGGKKTAADEWAIDAEGNVTRACFYANEADDIAQKAAYREKMIELGVTRLYYHEEKSVEEV